MTDDTVTLGGRTFAVPQFSIRQQRTVSPALMSLSGKAQQIGDPAIFAELIDTIYMCLTVPGNDKKPINDISKDEFEELPMGALEMATEVLPMLLRQAGLIKVNAVPGGAGDAAPQTPLSGATTSTT